MNTYTEISYICNRNSQLKLRITIDVCLSVSQFVVVIFVLLSLDLINNVVIDAAIYWFTCDNFGI